MTRTDDNGRTTMRRIAVITTALAFAATPAFAQGPGENQGQGDRGKSADSPAHKCKAMNMSQKKTNHGKGKSPFAACVSGFKKEENDDSNGVPESQQNPSRRCRSESRKKDSNDQMSPFAACVKGYAKAQREERS
jgi:hypothetical protein